MKKLIVFGTFLGLIIFFVCEVQAGKKALLVGISDYEFLPSTSMTGMSDLKGPLNDLENFKEILISLYEFSATDILTLKNENATRQAIEQNFYQWLVKGTDPKDTVVFYFSGHGSQVPDQNGDETDGYDEVICPYDIIPKGGKNIILDDELGIWLRDLADRRVIVIADCCNAGGVMRGVGNTEIKLGSTPAARPKFIPITGYVPTLITRGIAKREDLPGHVIFMAASREDEAALEIRTPDGFHGGFSYSFFQGMTHLHNPSYESVFSYASKLMKDFLQLPQEPIIVAKKEMLATPVFGRNKQKHAIPEVITKQIKKRVASPLPDGGEPYAFVAFEKAQNIGDLKTFQDKISRLPFVRLVEPDCYFDCLLQVYQEKGVFLFRSLNRSGDILKLGPADDIPGMLLRFEPHLKYIRLVKQMAAIRQPDPPFHVKTWVTENNRRDFWVGEKIAFGLESDTDCYALLLNIDSQGKIYVIFPNSYQPDNKLKPQTPVFIPAKNSSKKTFDIEFAPPASVETLKLIASKNPIVIKGIKLKSTLGFQTFSGQQEEIFIKKLVQHLTLPQTIWSEDTIVIRSHAVE